MLKKIELSKVYINTHAQPFLLDWESFKGMSEPWPFDRGKEFTMLMLDQRKADVHNHLTLTMPYFAYLLL